MKWKWIFFFFRWTKHQVDKKARKQSQTKSNLKWISHKKVIPKQQFGVMLIQLKWSFIVWGQLKLAWHSHRCCQMLFRKPCLAAHLALFVRRRMSFYNVAGSWRVCLAATVKWLQPQINSYHLSARLQFCPSLNSWTRASTYCTVRGKSVITYGVSGYQSSKIWRSLGHIAIYMH